MYLLGGYHVDLDGEAVYGFETDKARALLAYLAVEAGRPHRRESLAALLWPERPEALARANLRQALARIRRALDDQDRVISFLLVTPADVQFNTASDHWLDTAELERLASQAAPIGEILPECYCRDFLHGLTVPESEGFQSWVRGKQEYFHRLAHETLTAQAAALEAAAAHQQAVEAARRLLQLEPWSEAAHRSYMRQLALAGHREDALRQYGLCRTALATEFGVEPSPITTALFQAIREGRLDGAYGSEGRSGEEGGDYAPARRAGTQGTSHAAAARSPRIVGRDAELGQLALHLASALAGEGHVVFVTGEAGSGKTALLDTFAGQAQADYPGLLAVSGRCSAPGQARQLYAPFCEVAEALFGDIGSSMPNGAERLRAASPALLPALLEHGPDLIDSLVARSSVARRGDALMSGLPAAITPFDSSAAGSFARQDMLFDEVVHTLAALARRYPLLVTLDDLQWADEGSVALLFHLGSRLAGSKILITAAYRKSAIAIASMAEGAAQSLRTVVNELRRQSGNITVDLEQADGRGFLEAFIDIEPNRLGAAFRNALYAHTGGHALFTIESLRNLRERGLLHRDAAGRWVADGQLDWGALPARVEAAIADRIGRLSAAQHRILAVASVEGDEFTAEVVAYVTGVDSGEAIEALSGPLAELHLVRSEALRRAGGQTQAVYRFTHHLIQKYLYDHLDAVQREALHEAVAAALVSRVKDDPPSRETLNLRLARHYESAGMPLEACRALYEAGIQAVRLSAHRDAVRLLEHGLALLACEPSTEASADLERLLYVALLGPRRALGGVGTDSYASTLQQAARLQGTVSSGSNQLPFLVFEFERYAAQGHSDAALATAWQLHNAGEKLGDEALTAVADAQLGGVLVTAGRPALARGHFERFMAWQTPSRCAALRPLLGMDLGAVAQAWYSMDLWLLGQVGRAVACCRQAVARADAANDPFGLAWSHGVAALLWSLAGLGKTVITGHAWPLMRVAVEHGFAQFHTMAEVFAGREMVAFGDVEAGVARMQAAIADWRNSQMAVGQPAFHVLLCEGCLEAAGRLPPRRGRKAGRERLLAAALAAAQAGLADAEGRNLGMTEPELHRLQGEVLLLLSGPGAFEQALTCFRTALAVAQEQAALAWELRTWLSLVRLLAARRGAGDGVRAVSAARAGLAATYARFGEEPEDIAYPDQRAAARLLAGGNPPS
jgi:DNA-binding SARP family transcriptional activator/tetratricopeptide (TPR) repeat protein/energy-coupling factor transporter ATP-binding protein EcfA2